MRAFNDTFTSAPRGQLLYNFMMLAFTGFPQIFFIQKLYILKMIGFITKTSGYAETILLVPQFRYSLARDTP